MTPPRRLYVVPSWQRWLGYCREHGLDLRTTHVVYSARDWMKVCSVERRTEVVVIEWPTDGPNNGAEFEKNVRSRFVNVTEVY